jgi:hypothetical protein
VRSNLDQQRVNPEQIQKPTDAGRATRQHQVAFLSEQRDVGVDYVAGLTRSEQLPDSQTRNSVQRSDFNAPQQPGKIGLPGSAAPDLGDYGRACQNGSVVERGTLKDRTDLTIPPLDRNQSAGVEDNCHP